MMELQDSVFPQWCAQTVLPREKQVRRDTRVVIQVGEDLVVDHVRGELVKEVRDRLRTEVLAHLGGGY